MANLGENPELEERLFCGPCRQGASGKVLTYNAPEVSRLLEAGELELGGQCAHCGSPMAPAQAAEPPVVEPVEVVRVPRRPGRTASEPA